jgi:O-succinylbenzoate synthase
MRLFQYQLALKPPVPMRGMTLRFRSGLLLCEYQHDGTIRWSEAAPLPGFSYETVDEVIAAARESAWERFPSLSFARASLALPSVDRPIPMNALLLGSLEDAWRIMNDVADWPHRAVKWKVGRTGRLLEEIELTRALRATLREDQTLRLDANRAWTFREAQEFATAVRDCSLEYVEEPLREPVDCERLHDRTGLPYALDETLREPFSWGDYAGVSALIIKPTLMGDLTQFAEQVPAHVPWVFSACFESGVGLSAIAALAVHHQVSDVPAGLDTYRWLAHDTLRTGVDMSQGHARFPAHPFDVDFDHLNEIIL